MATMHRVCSEELINEFNPEHYPFINEFLTKMNSAGLITTGFRKDFSNRIKARMEYQQLMALPNIDIFNVTKEQILNFLLFVDSQKVSKNYNNSLIISPFFLEENKNIQGFVFSLFYILLKELKELTPTFYSSIP